MSGSKRMNDRWQEDHTAKAMPLRPDVANFLRMWNFRNDSPKIDAYTQILDELEDKNLLKEVFTELQKTSKQVPTINDIESLYNRKNASRKRIYPDCKWCDNTGRILAERIADKISFAFRCRCELGKSISVNIPYWDSGKHSKNFKRF